VNYNEYPLNDSLFVLTMTDFIRSLINESNYSGDIDTSFTLEEFILKSYRYDKVVIKSLTVKYR
jgi:hypothetical protein